MGGGGGGVIIRSLRYHSRDIFSNFLDFRLDSCENNTEKG